VAKCFKYNCHCGCPKSQEECEASHSDYKVAGGTDLSTCIHGVKWGGVRWDSAGRPTKPITTEAEGQALLKLLREKVLKKAGKYAKEAEERAAKAEAAALKAVEAAAKARTVSSEKTKAADKAKPGGGEAFTKALAAQKEAQRTAATRQKEAEEAKAKAKACAAEVAKLKGAGRGGNADAPPPVETVEQVPPVGPQAPKRTPWGKRGAGSSAARAPPPSPDKGKWAYYRSLCPDQLVDPLASAECKKNLQPVPEPFLAFDPTEMEEELRRQTQAPDYSFVRESGVAVKRLVADEVVSWPAEAVRRRVLSMLSDAGFHALPAVVAMPDRLAAYSLAHVAQHVEEERLVSWSGDVCGAVADGEVQVSWPALADDPIAELAQRLLSAVQDCLELAALDLKIEVVEWWETALDAFALSAAGSDGPPACTGKRCRSAWCSQPSVRRCAGLELGVGAAVDRTRLWSRCASALCGTCGPDLGLPSKPLRFCADCRPDDTAPAAPGRGAGPAGTRPGPDAVVSFGVPRANSEGLVLTPATVAGVSVALVDLGDALQLPDDLCSAGHCPGVLGLDSGPRRVAGPPAEG